MTWRIRRLEPGDESAFLDFYSHRVERARFERRFQWLYRRNPHGHALTWIAVHGEGGRIIGCTSIFPRRMWIGDHVALGSHGGDSFVDPEFRRRGIAKSLHDLSVTEMCAAGIRLHYGFPVPENLGAFLKIGAHSLGQFQVLRFSLTSAPVIDKLRLGRSLTSTLRSVTDLPVRARARRRISMQPRPRGALVRIEHFDEEFDRLSDETLRGLGVWCVRDRAYLNWRYFDNPSKAQEVFSYVEQGELQGFVALELHGDRCVVFDLLVRSTEAHLDSLIVLILERARIAGSSQVRFMSSPAGTYARAFLRRGFRLGARPMRNPLMVLLAPDEAASASVTNLDSWFLTYGDEDRESLARD